MNASSYQSNVKSITFLKLENLKLDVKMCSSRNESESWIERYEKYRIQDTDLDRISICRRCSNRA